MSAYGEIPIVEAVQIFCRMVGCEEDFVIGFTAEPGRLVVCMFLRDPQDSTKKMINEEGIPMVGDYTADFGTGQALSFVEGSGRPITELIDISDNDSSG